MAKRIIFNDETIAKIKHYAEDEQHTMSETCNKFTISHDVMRRLIYKHDIHPKQTSHSKNWETITPEKEKEVVNLFTCTHLPIKALCKEVHLEYYAVLHILESHFTEEEINKRKSKVYRNSKLADKNPMYGNHGSATNNWKGEMISDGQGYLITKKPEWYTGRVKSDYVFYHSVIMCEALGVTEIPKGFVVHHIDHNPLNNELSNLALMPMGAHAKLHAMEKKMMMKGSETIHTGVGIDEAQTPDLDRSE